MSRIGSVFERLKVENKSALIPYLTAGDPRPDATVDLMNNLVKSGADIIELGVPFSDPMADGPTIQAACERALTHKVSLDDVISMVKDFRRDDDATPVVLMGYLNPVEMMGYSTFSEKAAAAGIDGVIIVDCPPEESSAIRGSLTGSSLDMIFLASPTSSPERLELIDSVSSGFLYYVSLKGVTGSKALDTHAVEAKVKQIKQMTNLPVGVGFGVKDAETAAEVAKFADAVVVGSVLVSMIEKTPNDIKKIKSSMSRLIKLMHKSMDKVRKVKS